jgi:hypothetical protein
MRQYCKNRAAGLVAKRGAAFVTVALFCLQLVRVCVVVPTDSYICLLTDADQHAFGHHHHADEASHPVSGHGDLPSFEHCKDSLDGVGIIAGVVFLVPAATSIELPQPTWNSVQKLSRQPINQYLPPPFQPPRNII